MSSDYWRHHYLQGYTLVEMKVIMELCNMIIYLLVKEDKCRTAGFSVLKFPSVNYSTLIWKQMALQSSNIIQHWELTCRNFINKKCSLHKIYSVWHLPLIYYIIKWLFYLLIKLTWFSIIEWYGILLTNSLYLVATFPGEKQ